MFVSSAGYLGAMAHRARNARFDSPRSRQRESFCYLGILILFLTFVSAS
jgi:hypothetical protein